MSKPPPVGAATMPVVEHHVAVRERLLHPEAAADRHERRNVDRAVAQDRPELRRDQREGETAVGGRVDADGRAIGPSRAAAIDHGKEVVAVLVLRQRTGDLDVAKLGRPGERLRARDEGDLRPSVVTRHQRPAIVHTDVDPVQVVAQHGEIVARQVERRALPVAHPGIGRRIVGIGRGDQHAIADVDLDREPLPAPAGVGDEHDARVDDQRGIDFGGRQKFCVAGRGCRPGCLLLVVDREGVVDEFDELGVVRGAVAVGRERYAADLFCCALLMPLKHLMVGAAAFAPAASLTSDMAVLSSFRGLLSRDRFREFSSDSWRGGTTDNV